MEKKGASAALQRMITDQEAEHKAATMLLVEEFRTTYESLKPVNMIRKTIHNLLKAPDLKTDLVNAAMGMSAGFVTRKLVAGRSHNPLKQLSGMILGRLVSSNVTHNAEDLKEIAAIMLRKLLTRKG